MGFMYHMTAEDYCNIYEIAVKVGVKPGESMEVVAHAYMKAKGVKPIMTDLTKDELIEKLMKDGKNILDIETDENGVQDMNFFKKEDEGDKNV